MYRAFFPDGQVTCQNRYIRNLVNDIKDASTGKEIIFFYPPGLSITSQGENLDQSEIATFCGEYSL
jgi:hypothetical protein